MPTCFHFSPFLAKVFSLATTRPTKDCTRGAISCFLKRQRVRARVNQTVGLLLVAIRKTFMQRFNYFLAFFSIATICLLGYVLLAQSKTQVSPVVVSAVAPVYPPVARAIGLQGDYLIDVEIDRAGKVVSAEMSKNSKEPKFMREMFKEAANRWQFAPDEKAEKNRRVQITFTIRKVPNASRYDNTPIFYPPYKIEVRDNLEDRDTPNY